MYKNDMDVEYHNMVNLEWEKEAGQLLAAAFYEMEGKRFCGTTKKAGTKRSPCGKNWLKHSCRKNGN